MNKNVQIREALKITPDTRMQQGELEMIWDRCKQLHKGGNTLEIGAYKGTTSYIMASLLADYNNGYIGDSRHYIVDSFSLPIEDNEWNYEEHTREGLLGSLGDLSKCVVATEAFSTDNLTVVDIVSRKYDYVFIDGDHRYGTLLLELLMCDLVTDHILGHDYGHKGVTAAVDQFCEARGYKVNQWVGHFGLFEIIKNED